MLGGRSIRRISSVDRPVALAGFVCYIISSRTAFGFYFYFCHHVYYFFSFAFLSSIWILRIYILLLIY